MNRRLLFPVVAIVFAIAGLVPISAIAQTIGAGPYYATPSWDQQLQCDTTATCPRFVVLSNWRDANFPSGGAAVLDRETGLVWERSPSTSTFTRSNVGAVLHCAASEVGNRLGWKLPTIQELASLFDVTVPPAGPFLPAGHPFSNVQSSIYWSATDAPLGGAWAVGFDGGGVEPNLDKSSSFFVWCVRGGQGVDPQ